MAALMNWPLGGNAANHVKLASPLGNQHAPNRLQNTVENLVWGMRLSLKNVTLNLVLVSLSFYYISGTKYNILLLVAGGWSSWGPWGECSDSCGIAYQTRLRNCSNPKPSNGGLECEGQNEDTKQCGNPAEKCCKLSCCSEYELKSNSSLMYPKSGASKAKITPMFKCCQHLEWQNDKVVCLYNGKILQT